MTAGDRVILGLTMAGGVLRSSDQGQLWSRVNIGKRVADLALLSNGVGLALATPEEFFRTSDGGLSFESLKVAPFGALGLEVNDGGVDIFGVLGQRRWLPEQPSQFEAVTPRPRQAG